MFGFWCRVGVRCYDHKLADFVSVLALEAFSAGYVGERMNVYIATLVNV